MGARYAFGPWIFRLLIAVGIAGVASVAHAVMAPEVYEEGRRSAANHLQIGVDSVVPPSGGRGDCVVSGRVLTVFRGDMKPGEAINFNVSCYLRGGVPAGGTLWTDYDALKRAKYLEAFMTKGPQPQIVLDQVEIILAPRATAYCHDDSLSCESSDVIDTQVEPCNFLDRVGVLFGLIGQDCTGSAALTDKSLPPPTMRRGR